MQRPTAFHRRTPGYRFLWAGLLVWTVGSVVFYPRTIAIVDEDAYLTQAYLFRSGRLSYEDSGIRPPNMTVDARPQGGRIVSKYPPGTALWLLPFTFMGWRAVFLSGLLCALVGTWLFLLVLRRFAPDADPAWALLWLCYPTVTLFARTAMSDLPAATIVLAAFYCLVRGRVWLVAAGALLGLSALFRYANAALVVPFATLAAAGAKNRFGAATGLLAGFAPSAAALLVYNNYAFGGPLALPLAATGDFRLALVPRHLLFYALLLAAWYPLMLVAPALAPASARWRLLVPAATMLLFYSAFSYVHAASSPFERLAVGLRYLLPALPFFVLGTALTLERALHGLRLGRALPRIAVALAVLSSLAVHALHQQHLSVQEHYSRLVAGSVPEEAVLICDKDISELLFHARGSRDCRYYGALDTTLLADDRPIYAARLARPGRGRPEADTEFDSVVGMFPQRVLVFQEDRPARLRVFRLR